MDDQPLVLTSDSFLGALGAREFERQLSDVSEREKLFSLVKDYVLQNGCLAEDASKESALTPSELQLRVPGTALVVRIGAPQREELVALTALACYVFGTGKIDIQSITLASLTALGLRLRRLHTQYGERSVVEALAGLSAPTIEAITLALYARPCRFPKAGCRFHIIDGNVCGVTLDQVTKTVEHLERRGVLRKLNATEPLEFGVVL